MQIGLFGKANVGKSTFFSAATETSVPIGNFPFTTIEPNIGVAYVTKDCACRFFKIKHDSPNCIDGTRYIPIKLIDIAGLVPGAHLGKGLGNQFLDDARQAEVLIHVVDISGSTDIQGQPVPIGTHDPMEDIQFVEEEFDKWFLQILNREWDKLSREIQQKTFKISEGIARRFTGLGISSFQIQDVLAHMGLLNKQPKDWSSVELELFVKELRQKTKPILIAANKADLCKDLSILEKIHNRIVIPVSAESELLLRKASKAGLIKYNPGDDTFSINENTNISAQQKNALDVVGKVFEKITNTGVQKAIHSAVFDVTKKMVVYPVEDDTKLCNKNGDVLPDAKILSVDSTAKDLAELIHSDIAKGFLFAVDCKTKQRIGADHKLNDGDVIKIVSSMSRG